MEQQRKEVPPKHPDLPQKQTGGGEETGGAAAPPEPPDRPRVSPGSVDIIGIVPEGIRIDPDITEGHPGYEESGDSEVIPPGRLAGGGAEAPQGGK